MLDHTRMTCHMLMLLMVQVAMVSRWFSILVQHDTMEGTTDCMMSAAAMSTRYSNEHPVSITTVTQPGQYIIPVSVHHGSISHHSTSASAWSLVLLLAY